MYMSKIQKKSQTYHENIFFETFLQFLICGNLFENYNCGYDILELHNILVQIQFTTSKTKLDIQYSKLVTRVAERLKDLRKYQENLKFGWTNSLVPNLPSRTSTLPIAVKKHVKTDIKLFFSCPVIIPFCSKCFVRDCSLYSECTAIKHQYHIS